MTVFPRNVFPPTPPMTPEVPPAQALAMMPQGTRIVELEDNKAECQDSGQGKQEGEEKKDTESATLSEQVEGEGGSARE
ncbi:MAG: hypothetical protein Q9183_003749, partial [Haloplaca sp. 2 TL-2023]